MHKDNKKKEKEKKKKPTHFFTLLELSSLKKSVNIVLLFMCQFGPSYVTPAALLSQALNRWQVK